ncbi:MAG: sigma-70 family RNA polymerase sigma factor [Oscillospiraceae bacterium]|nr:sigma-70 family RNA polymerase sigma factor [Oscillospiraceae bacterium]
MTGKPEEDAKIIGRVLAGDANCFEAIVEKYEKMIYNLALSKTQNRESAQDISQECFLRAYKMLASYRTEGAFSTWIYRICQNLIYDYYRKSKKIQTVSLSNFDEYGESPHEKELEDLEGDPSEKLVRSEKIQKVRELIDSLPDDLREIIILRDLNDISYAQISEMLGIEEGTVKSRLHRAREKLKSHVLKYFSKDELF